MHSLNKIKSIDNYVFISSSDIYQILSNQYKHTCISKCKLGLVEFVCKKADSFFYAHKNNIPIRNIM